MRREGLGAQARAALLSAASELAAGWPAHSAIPFAEEARRLALDKLLGTGRFTPSDSGTLYEALLALDLSPGAGGFVTTRSAGHRAIGVYYTDPGLVRYLLDRTLSVAFTGGQPPRICDPACGSGAFLAAAAAHLRSAGMTSEQAAACLWGYDTDARAIALCCQAIAAAGAPVPAGQVVEADSLTHPLATHFDLVVGNPPFIASGLRGAAAPDPPRAALLRQRFPQAAAYKLNTYPLFVQCGIELLRPGGRLAFVLPDSLLLGKYFAGIRRFILDTCSIEELTLIRGDLWAHSRVGHTLLVILRREPEADLRSRQSIRLRLLASLAELSGGGLAHAMTQGAFAADPLARFRLIFSDADAAFLRHLESHPQARPLGESLRPYSGLIARAGQRSLLRSSYPDGAVHVQKAGRILYAGIPPESSWRPALRSGTEVERFWVGWRGEYALMEPTLLKSGGKRQWYEHPKLLLRQTADRLVCAYDATGLFCLNNMHLLAPRSERAASHLLYYAAQLNSSVLNRYWRLLTLEEGRLYPQIDLDMLALVPLLLPPEGGSPTYTDLVRTVQAVQVQPPDSKQRPGLLARVDDLVAEMFGVTGEGDGC